MIDLLTAVLRDGAPIVYVTLAGVLAQRAGVWNLGLEGLMIVGACAAVVGTCLTGSVFAGVALAVASCVLLAALLWFTIEQLHANPIIAGLGITGLGLGGTDLAVQVLFGSEASVAAPRGLPQLGASLGSAASLSILELLAVPAVGFIWWVACRTRFGLRLAACGEHPFAARTVGVNASRMRLVALLAGGVLCALGGADLALGSLHMFSLNMTAGRGFMAFAAVIFGAGHPIGAALAASFFALVQILGIRAQLAIGTLVPQQAVLALPYLATVAGIWIGAVLRRGGRRSAVPSELRDN